MGSFGEERWSKSANLFFIVANPSQPVFHRGMCILEFAVPASTAILTGQNIAINAIPKNRTRSAPAMTGAPATTAVQRQLRYASGNRTSGQPFTASLITSTHAANARYWCLLGPHQPKNHTTSTIATITNYYCTAEVKANAYYIAPRFWKCMCVVLFYSISLFNQASRQAHQIEFKVKQ